MKWLLIIITLHWGTSIEFDSQTACVEAQVLLESQANYLIGSGSTSVFCVKKHRPEERGCGRGFLIEACPNG